MSELYEPLVQDSEAQPSSPGSTVTDAFQSQDPAVVPVEELGNSWPCILNLCNVILGAGMLALPRAFFLLGAVPGTLCFVVIGALTCFTLSGLARVSRLTDTLHYTDAVARICGQRWRFVLQAVMVFACFGGLVVYLVVVGDLLVGTAPDYRGIISEILGVYSSHVWFMHRGFVLLLVCTIILGPLVMIRSIELLTFFNYLGVMGIVAFAASTLMLAATAWGQGQLHAVPLTPNWSALGSQPALIAVQLSTVVAVVLSADTCHQNLHPLMRMLRPYTQRRLDGVVRAAVSICTLLYLIVSAACVAVFGSDTRADVLTNLDTVTLKPMLGDVGGAVIAHGVRVGFLLSLLGSFALVMHPLRDVCLEAAVPRRAQHAAFPFATLLLLGAAYGVAVFVPSVWQALGFLGATGATALAFLLPGVMMLLQPAGRGWTRTVTAVIAAMTVLVGLLIPVVTVVSTFLAPAAGHSNAVFWTWLRQVT